MARNRRREARNEVVGWIAALAISLAAFSTTADAQTQTSFGGFAHDTSQPIEVAADSLEVRNADKVAVFRGKVIVKQGPVRLTARELFVTYASGGDEGAIDRLRAIGDVIISNGTDTAEANEADYNVAAGEIVMSGDVLLVQGENAITGQELRIDLSRGVATMGGGRVTVILDPSSAGQ